MALRYTGGGYGGSLHGIPARDLSDADVASLAEVIGMTEPELIASGLYEPVGETKMTRRKHQDKSAEEGRD